MKQYIDENERIGILKTLINTYKIYEAKLEQNNKKIDELKSELLIGEKYG